nr:MAG TPA: hypothetical protein [Bacteriophage sp.]
MIFWRGPCLKPPTNFSFHEFQFSEPLERAVFIYILSFLSFFFFSFPITTLYNGLVFDLIANEC